MDQPQDDLLPDRAQAVLADLGMRALASLDLDATLLDALKATVDVLRVDLAGFLEARPEAGTYRFRAGVGWREGLVGGTVPASRAAAITFMQQARTPIIYEDLASEQRFEPPRILLEHGVVSGIGVVVPGAERPLGVLGVHARDRRTFTDADVAFTQSVATILANALERDLVEVANRERENRFRRLTENAQDLVFRIHLSPTMGFDYINPASQALLDYTPDELLADPALVTQIIHPDDRANILDPRPGDDAVTIRLRTRSGEIVWCDTHLVTVTDDAGVVVAVEGIARDVTERRRENELLRRAYEREHTVAEELRSLDSMKNAFLQAVSHDLRTPLASVLGIALTLQEHLHELKPEDQTLLIDRLGANARRLERLLGDLLDLDRLMRRTIQPNRIPTEVRALVEQTVREVELGGRTLHLEGEDVTVPLDGPKVERIVENLLTNVARHTHSDANVWIRVESAADGVLITVEDDGPGIPAELQAAVFEPFQQGPSRSAHSPGAGIGLSLVARFAELHGGRAWVEDRPEGGARFRVLLPASGERIGTTEADPET